MQTHLIISLRPARKLPIHSPVIVGARGKNRFRKHIGITGTRFTRKRKRRSGNWIIEAVSLYLSEPKAVSRPNLRERRCVRKNLCHMRLPAATIDALSGTSVRCAVEAVRLDGDR